ncbi:MAG: redox-regulated ATPase YchF [archaeon]
MAIKIGVVGAPNKGKSTFFKAVTLKDVDIANYPFTTIKPNVGVGFVTTKCPCAEFKVKCAPQNSRCIDGIRLVPVELVDIAGLVPLAHEGKGMGNQFLSDISLADVMIHVIDCSGKTDVNGEGTDGADVTQEVEFLENEIGMWLYGIISSKWDKYTRLILQLKSVPLVFFVENLSTYGITETDIVAALDSMGKGPEDIMALSPDELKEFVFELIRLSKCSIILANKIDMPTSAANLEMIRAKYTDKVIIPASCEAELALRNAASSGLIDYVPGGADFKVKDGVALTDKQKKGLEFLRDNVLKKYGSTGVVTALNKAVFDVLGYIVVYPVENETHFSNKNGQAFPDAILIRKGSNALDLAYKIHTDIGDHFIRAINARTKQVVGKDYVLKADDIIKIVAGK